MMLNEADAAVKAIRIGEFSMVEIADEGFAS